MDSSNNRTLKDYFGLTLRGMVIGSADIVPGVSGGTMAFILGIYNELINAIRSIVPFLKNLIRLRWREAFEALRWRFLLAVGLGIGLAILSLASFLNWALHEHPEYIFALFFGLVVASIFIVRKRVKRWSAPSVLAALVAAAGAYLLIGLAPANTPNSPLFIFLSGAIAICAMILPGISGAFILVLLGKYHHILGSLLALDVVTIMVFMAGAAVGIIAFSNLLRWLLDHHHDLTIAVLLGFMGGALRKVWPWKDYDAVSETFVHEINVIPASLTGEVAAALGLMVLGVILVLGVETYAARRAQG